MVTLLLCASAAVASFAAAAALVFAIVRLSEHLEPSWWPEFEREFGDYLAAGDDGRS